MEISRVSVRVSSAGVLLLILYSAAVADGSALTTDGLSLLALKSAVSDDPTGALHSWIDTDSNPCRWRGVACSPGGRVASLSLSNLSLSGYLPSELSLLSDLHTLSLPRNLFSGPLPAAVSDLRSLSSLDLSFNNLSGAIPASLADLNKSLAVLDLSHNAFSGSIPTVLGAMDSLSRLDLSSNRLSGTLPPSIAALPALSGVLNLSCNLLSGEIPPEFGSIPVAVSLDLRLNNLSGEIPPVGSLLNQGPTAFAGNPGLCGFPLRKPCFLPRQDRKAPQPNPSTDPSTPTPRPIDAEPPKRRTISAVPILAAVVIAAVVSVLVLQWQFRKRRTADGKTGSRKGSSSSTAAVAEEWREGRSGEVYVPLDEEFALELEDLLRASAYVVGKSRSGIVYKVVVARGSAVAVRRLSEAEDGDGEDEWRRRRAFESEAATIGRVRHPNVVALRAYYYASDEKLLIYDYIPNGTLHGALHGAAAPPPLPWTARLAILQGAARGLACIHECSPRKYVHGSVRTAKILLDEELRPYVSGFGLTRLAAGARFSHSASKKSGSSAHLVDVRNAAAVGYAAPEVRAAGGGAAATQRSDVYAFGVVMLEVLTGREAEGDVEGFVRGAFREERPLSEVVDPALLGEVHAKKEVLAVFHVALGCTEADPEARPRMQAVSESLERVGTQS